MSLLTHSFTPETDPTLPKISDERLIELARKFSLVYMDANGDYYLVDLAPYDMGSLRLQSCLWDPKLTEPVTFGLELRRVPFYVTCAYHGFFKPSIAEVLSQAPIEELDQNEFNAFYIENHVDILASGSFQKATACFVRLLDKP